MSREMMSLIPYILRHCPNLYELSAAFHSSLDVASVQNPTTLPPRMKGLQAFDYNKLPLPQIQALRIDSHVEGTYLSEKLIRIWPDVRHLVLNGHALHEILGPPSNTNQTSVGMLKLRELQLGKIRTTKGPIMNTTMINLLLCSSAGHLTILDLLGMDSSGITYLEEVLVRHGRHLRSLRLPQLDIHIRTPWLRHCTSLEEIMIDSYPPKDVRANLPKEKLVHASFSNKAGQENYSLKPMIQWLESLPAVETFTWITRKGNKKNNSADAADLKQACARMGIRLRLLTVMTVQVRFIFIFICSPSTCNSQLTGLGLRFSYPKSSSNRQRSLAMNS